MRLAMLAICLGVTLSGLDGVIVNVKSARAISAPMLTTLFAGTGGPAAFWG